MNYELCINAYQKSIKRSDQLKGTIVVIVMNAIVFVCWKAVGQILYYDYI